MSASRERFIQLALRPLLGRGQAEDDAAAELSARLHHAGDDPALLADAVARLEECQPPPAWRLPVIAAAVIALLAGALAFLVPGHWEEGKVLEKIHGIRGPTAYHASLLHAMGPAGEDVPLKHRYFDPGGKFQMEIVALLARYPRDGQIYRYHACWHRYLSGSNPPDYLEKWSELDPGNAAWGIEHADFLAKQAIPRVLGVGWPEPDERLFKEALETMQQAAKRDSCHSSFNRIRELQLASFTPEPSVKSMHVREGLLDLSISPGGSWMSELSLAVAIQAEWIEARGDVEALETLMSDYRKILDLVVREKSADPAVVHMVVSRWIRPLKAICKKAGLAGGQGWLDRLDRVPASSRGSYSRPEFYQQAGSLHRKISQFDSVSASELKPGRMAEYSVADRFCVVAALLVVLPLLAAFSLEMLRRGAGARALACGVSPLFRRADWLWLIGLGLAAPMAWWLGVVRFTPLGARDVGLSYVRSDTSLMLLQWLSQGLGGILLLIISLYQTARWRWAKRGVLLSLNSRGMWVGWAMVVLAALFIPALGLVRYIPVDPHKFIYGISAGAAIPLLWLLWRVCMGLFTSKENSLQGLLTLRAMLPGLMAMVVLLLAAIPLLRMEERGWVEGDVLLKPAPDGSGLTFAESREYDLLRPQLIKALEGDGRGVESP